MKKLLLAATVATLAMNAAQAAPTLYGKLNVTLDNIDNNGFKDESVTKVNSNASRIGVKGEEKLTDNLSAVYLAEWQFNTDGDGTDTGSGTDLTQRNRFVGLKDAQLGTVKIGVHDTPLKQLSSVVDTFNNYVANKADIGGILGGETRVSNAVVYESPAVKVPVLDGAIKVSGLLATGEATGIDTSKSGVVKTAGRGLGDAWSASASFESPLLVAGIAYDKAIPSTFLGRGFLNASDKAVSSTAAPAIFAAANTIRAIGRVNPVNGLALKALFQSSEVENVAGNTAGADKIDDAKGWLLGAEYTIPQAKNWTVKGQYSQNTTSFKDTTADFEAKQIIGGVDYAFNKQVKTYGYAGYLTLEQASKKDKQPVAGLGLEFKF